jgi:hypothetical protein
MTTPLAPPRPPRARRPLAALAIVVIAAPAELRPCAALAAAGSEDSAAARPRVVRRFDEILVRAAVADPRAITISRPVTRAELARLPIGGLVARLGLLPGVVLEDGALHVRGGRAGEVETS